MEPKDPIKRCWHMLKDGPGGHDWVCIAPAGHLLAQHLFVKVDRVPKP